MLHTQLSLKRNMTLLIKMYYLGGYINVSSPFNNTFDGTVSIYGSYTNQPFTRFKWTNGIFTNFIKINLSINN